MNKITNRKSVRQRIRYRVRAKVRGTAEQPRLAVYRSLSHIYVQAIDDSLGATLATAGSHETALKATVKHGGNVEAARAVGKLIAERLRAKGVEGAVFDRGGFVYHGRVKALAEAAREGGLKF